MATFSTTARSTAAPTRWHPAHAQAARPARRAVRTLFNVSIGLGITAFAALAFVVARLFSSWRVVPGATAGHVRLLGQSFSYPTANTGAVVIVLLGLLALVAGLTGLGGLTRELLGAWKVARGLSRLAPRVVRGARVIDDPAPRAFCAGMLRPRIYISTGALALLDDDGLEAVLAHERHHARRRDPLRIALGRVTARALFFLPTLTSLISRHQRLTELCADEAAVAEAPALRPALARAMLSFMDAGGPAAGASPERVDHLVGEAVTWDFPRALGLGALALIGAVAALAALVGRSASGSATLALPLVSGQPCLLLVAVLAGALCCALALRRV